MPAVLTTTINSLVSLFLLMALGYFCRKAQWIDDHISFGFSNLLLKVTLPCTILVSMQREFSVSVMADCFRVLGASILTTLAGAGLGALLAKLLKAKPNEKNIWVFVMAFANVGYAGFPIMSAIYGMDGLIFTSMANVTFNLLAFTLGPRLFQPQGDPIPWRRILLSPAPVATLIGFVLFMTSLRIPAPVGDAVSFVAGLTTPMSMIIVGAILAKSDIRKIFTGGKVYAVLLMRLFVMPALALAVLKPLIHNPTALGVAVLLAGMPAASLTAILAEQYQGNAGLSSQIIFLSTVFSLGTIPMITLFLF